MSIGYRTFMALLFCVFFIAAAPLQGAEGTLIGGTPHEKWEEGGNDFFVMFNSLIDDQRTMYGEDTSGNRQGDTCIESSSFILNGIHTPDDVVVLKAYLVWMGAVDPANFAAPTDNAVHLKFAHEASGYSYEEDVIAGDTAKTIGDTSDPFLFQSVQFQGDVSTGCSESAPGSKTTGEVAYFTYRTDITPFFTKIYDDNRAAETPLPDGEALYGTYTFSGLDCTQHDYYLCNTTMVSNWSILFVYKSGKVRSKKIYFYPGFAWSQGETTTAEVSGFELPRNPIVRITTMIAEGDPSLVKATLPPELIYIRGQNATSSYILENDCNPYVDETMSYEIYNSNSSIYGWDPDDVQLLCVSGGISEQYYGIDADTFLLDSEDDINLQEHLTLGGTSLNTTLSVNQDAILTNYLIVSVDTKTPAFDIPKEETSWPDGREKHFCSCRRAEDKPDSFCGDRPMYYLIKVQNWGTNDAVNVMVSDDIPTQFLTYVPGTTEMSDRFDENGNGTCWTAIDDKAGSDSDPNSKFPLAGEGVKVADKMEPCNQATHYCKDTRLIRFKVTPKKDLPKNTVIPNKAVIKESGSSEVYYTNTDFDLSLYFGTCQELAVCAEPEKVACGGITTDATCNTGDRECDESKPCQTGYVCDMNTFTCIPDPNVTCSNSKVSYDIGTNSPESGGSNIIIPTGTQDLMVAQFKFSAVNCVDTKYFDFTSVRLKIVKEDAKVIPTNIELIYDKDGSGTVDPGEPVIGTVEAPDATGAYFVIDKSNNRFTGQQWHHIIVRADIGYNGADVPNGATFRFMIENKSSFLFEDAGSPQPDGDPITFATFQVEPTANFFIVTKGMNDPEVPPESGLFADIPILQLRTKALDAANTIRRLVLSTGDGSIALGGKGGIRSISLYLDTNGDGIPDGNAIETIASFDDPENATFEGETIESVLNYGSGAEMFLIVTADLSSMPKNGVAQLVVKKGAVSVTNSTKKVEGLPVYSKRFQVDESIQTDDDVVDRKDDACNCSLVTW